MDKKNYNKFILLFSISEAKYLFQTSLSTDRFILSYFIQDFPICVK